MVPAPIVRARRAAGALLTLSALLTLMTLVALLGAWVTKPRTVTSAAIGTAPTSPPTPGASVGPPSTTLPTITPSAPPGTPQEALQRQLDNDRSRVGPLIGVWVPQLSSKAVGLHADGIVYDNSSILQDFLTTRSRFPDALLLYSDDYASFKLKGYFVTVVPIAYSTGEEANAWCDSQGIDRDHCFAKRLMYTGGPEGNTLHRT